MSACITTRNQRRPRAGVALLVAIFVMSVCTALVLNVIDTEMLEVAQLRNTIDYEKATYLAAAAVHEALTNLETNFTWRTGISTTTFPVGGSSTYSATVVDGSGGTVIITGTGVSGSITRKLTVTVQNG